VVIYRNPLRANEEPSHSHVQKTTGFRRRASDEQ
jgi:hypothetical protein